MKRKHWSNKRFLFAAAVGCLLAFGCDDSESVTGGGISDQNVPATCGDGIHDDGEVCDDGNRNSGDGCSAACQPESGYDCPPTGVCTRKTAPNHPAVCGNSILETGENCDDGNNTGGDGCSSNCRRESGYACPTPGEACHESSECGDSIVNGDETCDDGNSEGGDGCSSDCQTESGYSCPTEGDHCVPQTCGNGIVEEGEACDNGDITAEYNAMGGDVQICGPDCQWAHYCGDSKLDAVDRKHGEECDNGGLDNIDEYDGCSADCKRGYYCGDGQMTHNELCDDGNSDDGDGCSSTCKPEYGYICKVEGQACEKIPCGNGVLESGELCDDGNRDNGDGCSQACMPEPGYVCPAGEACRKLVCNDGVIEGTESCEDGNTNDGDGCSSNCQIEPGWICPGGKDCHVAGCGDGIVAGKEECDDGNNTPGDGCNKYCDREPGFACLPMGGACHPTVCGDGIVEGDETCDEGTNQTDGCARPSCQIVMGWLCETAGSACVQGGEFGNGILEGAEQCDEGPGNQTAGCVNGIIQPGWRCEEAGKSCVNGYCGDGSLDKGEQCDDHNNIAGDGCDPLCRKEAMFVCKPGEECKPVCGDGITMWMLNEDMREECDDGNTISGDGCSADCKKETGWVCTDFHNTTPDYIDVPANYYDFIHYQHSGSGDGYMTSAFISSMISGDSECSGRVDAGRGFPDFQRYGGYGCDGMVHNELDADGKPVLNSISTSCTNSDCNGKCTVRDHLSCGGSYHYWYRYEPGVNRLVKSHLRLFALDKTKGTYRFDSSKPCSDFQCEAGSMRAQTASGDDMPIGNFVPINKSGYCEGVTCDAIDIGGFTTEIKTYFQYKGGESLTFQGNDDVWVFLNNKLFVDLGGMQPSRTKTGTLAADKYKDTGKNYDSRYDVYEGGIYAVTLFNAERMMTGSSFQLTLSGFVNAGTASCDAICGDGMVRGGEECDPVAFANPGAPTAEELEAAAKAGCVSCKVKPYCGNNKREGLEQCDGEDWCTKCEVPGCDDACKFVGNTCGNGQLDPHEQCDPSIPDTPAGTCLENCYKVGCGNGIVEVGEECDDGNEIKDDGCSNDCKRPYCGDGIQQELLGELCDDGINDGSYNGCGLGCSYLPPRCGDAIIQTDEGEECDLGTVGNNGGYGACTTDCKLTSRCGDGIIDTDYEACDDGPNNGKTGYCASNCLKQVN